MTVSQLAKLARDRPPNTIKSEDFPSWIIFICDESMEACSRRSQILVLMICMYVLISSHENDYIYHKSTISLGNGP